MIGISLGPTKKWRFHELSDDESKEFYCTMLRTDNAKCNADTSLHAVQSVVIHYEVLVTLYTLLIPKITRNTITPSKRKNCSITSIKEY